MSLVYLMQLNKLAKVFFYIFIRLCQVSKSSEIMLINDWIPSWEFGALLTKLIEFDLVVANFECSVGLRRRLIIV